MPPLKCVCFYNKRLNSFRLYLNVLLNLVTFPSLQDKRVDSVDIIH